jgi:hypothetical protein
MVTKVKSFSFYASDTALNVFLWHNLIFSFQNILSVRTLFCYCRSQITVPCKTFEGFLGYLYAILSNLETHFVVLKGTPT